ncbi:MAG: alpha/beta fold hydrolase [Bacteroidetes bacterium]|nr:alpha/beta fold hydrolase [Bacteroidota bacterium]
MRCMHLILILLFISCFGSSVHAQTAEQKSAASAFIDAVAARAWDLLDALSHPTLREKITTTQWEELIDDLEAKAGTLEYHRFHQGAIDGPFATIVHRVYFAKDSIAVRVMVDSSNLVGGFWLNPVEREYRFPPPSYADTLAFHERELSLGEEHPLPATLTVPDGAGPFPAVVLVHGSGPQDRDQTTGGNKIFRDIAWGLASRGVMVLRYDKRTKLYGKKMNRFRTTVQEETIDDAVLAIDVLARQPEADTNRLILVGHSLGALLAPEIATLAPSVDAIVMLAPIARPLEVVIGDQLRFIASTQDSLTIEERSKLNAELDKIQGIQDSALPPTTLLLGMPASYYYDMHKRDQHMYARTLGKPLFIARGMKDYQSSQMEFILWREILEDVPDTAFRTYNDCYHLFIRTDATPGPWNYQAEGHVVEELIDDLEVWCRELSLPPNGDVR